MVIEHYEMSLLDVEPSTIDIDGTSYPLASPDDYSVPELRAVNRMWTQVQEWDAADSLTAKQGVEYDKHVDALVRYACPSLPDDVKLHKNFQRSQKTSIIIAFFIEAGKRHPLIQKAGLTTLLQNSNDSMAEVSENG